MISQQRRLLSLIFFCTFLFSGILFAAEQKKFKLLLIPEKKEYHLGENILIHYALVNEGKNKLSINLGGDYRGAWRAHRFKVHVLFNNKDTVADPFPSAIDFGGLSSDFIIQPKDTFFYTLQLNYFARITKGGSYSIYVKHDLGWREKEQATGQLNLNILEPDSVKANQLVQEMLTMEKDPSWSYGKKRTQFADFNSIRNPVFYSPLAALADNGNADAITALGSLYCQEASWKLLSLLSDADTTHETLISTVLSERIPIPLNEGTFFADNDEERNHKIKTGWTKKFSEQTELIAIRFLKSANKNAVNTGAYFVRCIGSRETIFPLMKALTHEIRSGLYADTPGGPVVFLSLKQSAAELLSKYSFEPLQGSSEGQDILFLIKFQQDKNFRPNDWKNVFVQLLNSKYPLLVQTALECLPFPPEKEFLAPLKNILSDSNAYNLQLVCSYCSRLNDSTFDTPVMNIIKNSRHEYVLNAARAYAEGRPAAMQALKILSQRLNDSLTAPLIMEQLRMLLVAEGSGSFGWNYTKEEANKIQQAWKTFLEINTSVLKNGKKISVKNKIIRKELFPASYEWVLDNGKH